jgi:hypothetical protein
MSSQTKTKNRILAVYNRLKDEHEPAEEQPEPVHSDEVPPDWDHDFLTWSDEELAELEVYLL